jgi:hypothetical protein
MRPSHQTVRLTALTLAFVLTATLLRAQAQASAWSQTLVDATADARRQLRSADPREVAWGAFRAAEYRLAAVIPDLRAVLQAPPSGDSVERSAMIAALLDAAMELDARLPAAELTAYWDRWPVHTSALLARADDPAPVLLDLLRTASGFRWYALANLLAETKTPGFAKQLFASLTVRVSIAVSEQGNTGRVSGGVLGASVGDGVGINLPGYPPIAIYRFESGPRRLERVLSTGPRVLYYSRTVSYAFQFGVSDSSVSGPDDDDRVAYLRTLLPGGAENPIRAQQFEHVAWRGVDDLMMRVSAIRESVNRRYQQLVTWLVEARQLTQADAQALSPRIEISVVDLRDDRSQPLPSIER